MSSKQFNNELGNAIIIKTEEKDIENIPGILFSITGPNSETEVHITRQEAEILCKELQAVLASKNQ